MKNISCLIVEDEPHAMLLLQDHISKVPGLLLEGSFYDAMSAMQYLREHPVELLFLDINMPRISGMELAAMLPPQQKIIFTTAYSEHAIDSFEFSVVDYLLKPVSFKRFMQAVNKLQSFMPPAGDSRGTKAADTPADQFLFVKSGRQAHRIEYASIRYLEAVKEYVAIHTGKEKILVYKRMKELAALLPVHFVRIHNSYIVNLQHVNSIGQGVVQVENMALPVSNGYRSVFQEKLQSKIL